MLLVQAFAKATLVTFSGEIKMQGGINNEKQ